MMDKKCVPTVGGTGESEVKPVIPESIILRNEQRLEKEAKRRNTEEGPKQLTAFLESFKSRQNELEDALDGATALKGNRAGLGELFREVSHGLQLLNKDTFASSGILRPFDLRTCKEVLHDLEEKARETEDRLLPKKKFGFKAKSTVTVSKKSECSKSERKGHDEVDSVGLVDYLFHDKKGATLRAEVSKRDVILSRLEDCTVVLSGCSNTLTLESIKGCILVSGPVTTSVVVETCTNSRLALACQQLRIHNTSATDFYLHTTTKPIVEDSTSVRFAPYTVTEDGAFQEILREAGLDPDTNRWDQADDFNWLSSTKSSPNWSLVPQDQRLDSWPQ